MYCRFCGSKIADNSVFCTNCGKNLAENTEPALAMSAVSGGTVNLDKNQAPENDVQPAGQANRSADIFSDYSYRSVVVDHKDDVPTYVKNAQSRNVRQETAPEDVIDRREIDNFLYAHVQDLPQGGIDKRTRDKLNQCSEKEFSRIRFMSFKSTTLMVVLSIFFGAFGVDHFMISDTEGGVKRICINWISLIIYWIISGIAISTFSIGLMKFSAFLGFAVSIILIIYNIVDICGAMRRTREYNLLQLKNALHLY
jgi:hypothetical protein